MKHAISMFAMLMFAFVVFFSFAPFVANAQTNQLIYGQTYHLINGYENFNGGYLDTRNRGCNGNAMCVTTSYGKDRDAGSGSWKIKPFFVEQRPGQPVMNGQVFLLENQYRVDGDKFTYLDTRDRGCDNAFCVTTSFNFDRDRGSGLWKIFTDNSSGSVVLNQPVRLLNGYGSYQGGYLDTRGSGCDGNKLCVSTTLTYNRDNGSTLWKFVE